MDVQSVSLFRQSDDLWVGELRVDMKKSGVEYSSMQGDRRKKM